MYLRPDEVARVLEKVGFEVDEITPVRTAIVVATTMFTSIAKRVWGARRWSSTRR